ncbi:MAG: ribonucleoside triphosphate reductase [Candidatus Cloacimonadota bacterium]|nr:MAG: ribonucleoside triphosphate reductase [Candidatus Cloacimonadota bacterium]PIE80609.1 MAG: ribonucleoside triphosphate reductase [Candidatus Delongbacteria bacterium]
MFSKIRKRDGQIFDFNSKKIRDAIGKAGKETGEFGFEIAKSLTLKVLSLLEQTTENEIPTVEEVQDIVEEVLLNSPYKSTAKAYIIYRDQHSKIRDIISSSNIDMVDSYLSKLDWQVKENSNMCFSLQGLNNYLASEVSKTYWLNKIYSSKIKKAHQNGDLHIHDLNLISVYCVGWDLHDLLCQGFRGVSGKVESKPPKHFKTALGQIVNFFYTLQGEAAGAQALSSFDTLLAPFVRYDNLDYKEVKQAIQEFIFNINVPTRVGFQTPFTNITMDLVPPSTFADNPVIIGGEPMETTYSEYQEEMNLINRAYLEVMNEGDARGRVFTFPIPTYNITKDFDWENRDLDPLWESTAKYGIPYFSNFINSDLSPDDSRSMCCRLRLDTRELESRGGGLFGANPLTGSIGVVTLNLPRLAYKSNGDLDKFLKNLKEMMEIAKDSLETKRKVLEKLTDSNLYPYTKFYLRYIKERYGVYWKNHFSTIGILGMNEALLNLKGFGIESTEGKELSLMVMDYIRDTLIKFQKETGNNYNLEATPAEGTTFRLAKLDKESFPDIICANEENHREGGSPYYTNSTQLPVNYSSDPFEVLDQQDELQTKYTGGTVLHLFTGEKNLNPQSVKFLVKKICHEYRLPYFTISPTFSICPTHGYLNGEVEICPDCQSTCEIYSRVVGYIRPINQWNDGKQEEFKARKTFILSSYKEREIADCCCS